MADFRVWHASRDAYHCAFRLTRLLLAHGAPLELERLRILDLFLLYPALLHRTSMPQDVKAQFRELNVAKPEDTFIRIPSAAAVFQDLRLYQNSAVSHLVARGLFRPDDLRVGMVEFPEDVAPQALVSRARGRNDTDGGLTEFLVGPLSGLPLRGPTSIYRKAGLPTRSVSA